MSSVYHAAIAEKAAVYKKTAEAIIAKATSENRALSQSEQTDIDNLIQKAENAIGSAERARRVESFNPQALTVPGNPGVTVTNDNRSDAPWHPDSGRAFGEFLGAVARAMTPGGDRDPRLEKRAVSGLNEGVGASGGFLLDSQFSSVILQKAYADGQILSRVTRIPVDSNYNGLKIPTVDESSRANGSRWGGVSSQWTGEGSTATASKPSFGRIDLSLKKVQALGYATEELMMDRAALGTILLQAFASELRFRVEDAIVRGDGVGKPLGFLSSGALVTLAKESSQSTATVISENVFKLFSRMHPGSINRAVWLANVEIAPYLFAMTVGGSGGATPVFMPANGAADRPFNTLLGRPLLWVEQASGLGAVGDISFVDLSEYLLIEKGGMQAAESMHVKFETDEMTFKVTWRVDGAPAWKSALQPFKGSNTVSPFVTLAARP